MADKVEQIKYLVNMLNEWTKAYDEGHPVVSDKEWDDNYFHLVELEAETGIYLFNSPTQRIEFSVMSNLEKVKHNHPMLSLDKTKDWEAFKSYFENINASKDVVGMVKLDGLTCSLRYLNGRLVSAETRGNGEIGENIFHNASVIRSIPNRIEYTDELIIDGEVICTEENFASFSDEYKNPRNFAAGSIRLLDSNECFRRNLTFVVWNVIKGLDTNSLMEKFGMLDKLGFTTTPWVSSLDLDAKEYLINSAKDLGYPIDGLVGRFDDITFGESLGSTEHHSKAAYAFKFYDEEYETELLNIEWSLGRSGQLTPVAIFNPIEIDGTIVERASLHNLSIVKETLGVPYRGQKLWVSKRNMIIPQIEKAERGGIGIILSYPGVCPVCGQETTVSVSDEGVGNVICPNSKCNGKLANIIDHYVGKQGMDVKGLSISTIEKLIDWEWVTKVSDIYDLHNHKEDWIRKEGFGQKSVSNILEAIEKSKNCDLAHFISAIGIPGIGFKNAKLLANKYETWQSFRQAIEGEDSMSSILSIDGFGASMYENILSFDYSEADVIYPLLSMEAVVSPSEQKDTLSGKTICVTGKLTTYKNRNELIADIEAHGGKVTGSVTAKTAYLVNNDSKSQTAKNQTAIKLGVEIITEKDFKEKFLI